ncbi:MAG: hypothetical protein ACRD2T_06145, partial [Thermoanaerobaculia bacterium]
LLGAVAGWASEPSRALLEEGTRHLEERRYQQAIQAFERALGVSPGSRAASEGLARAHAGLGVEFTNSGEHRSAREAFERSLRAAEDSIARFGLGYLDFLELRDGPARDNLERVLAGDSRDGRAWKLLALIDYRRGEGAAALRGMARAAELTPDDAEARALEARWRVEAGLFRDLASSRTRHFLVRSDPSIHPEALREILTLLEGIHDAVGQALGHWPKLEVPVVLLGQKEFAAATGSRHWVGGVYDGQIKVPVQPEEARPGAARKLLMRTLRHEYTHALVKEICPGCPNWLNEGIAQYFELEESRDPTSGAAKERAARLERLKGALQGAAGRRLPLEKIPARMSEISDEGLAQLTYMEGLGFVAYLAENHRAFRLRLLLAACQREGSLGRAFEITYGSSLGELEARWWRSVVD